jgi:hypothetical protein
MDLFGTLKIISTHKKLTLCVTDAFSKYAELGLPLEISSDNSKGLCKEIVDTLLKLMSTNKTNTTPYHPQTYAQAEIFNKINAAYLKTQVLNKPLDWEHYIAYNISYQRSIKTSPFEVTFRIEPRATQNTNQDI